MTEILAAIVRTFAVLLSRRAEVDAALTALAKRAARKGIPGALTWTWGAAYKSTALVPNREPYTAPVPGATLNADGTHWTCPVARVDLTLTGETPRLNGWRFVATLQHIEGATIVRALPGEDIPACYRNRGSVCDHCNANRRRNDTYVLRHEDGRTMQVGSSCIRDFLGGDDAALIAAKAEILALAASVAGDDGDDFGMGRADRERLISDFLPIVAWAVRVDGWRARWTKCPYGGEPTRNTDATADRAWTLLTDARERVKAGCEPTAEDIATAEGALTWAESLTDAEVEGDKGDYLHNVRSVARAGLCDARLAGIAASFVTAYQRHVGRERAKAERAARPTLDAHVGTVGARVTFGLPAQVGKRGKPLKNAPTVLSANPVTLDFVTGYATDFGYTHVLKFRTSDGASLVWKASGDVGIGRDDVGKSFTLAGTIKAHSDYKGAKQTLLTRCDVREAAAPSAPTSYVPPADDYSVAV